MSSEANERLRAARAFGLGLILGTLLALLTRRGRAPC
jgi:hypothetical protein